MPVNMGGLDRILRFVAGGMLVGLAATGTIGAWGYIGVVLLATAVVSRCPAYVPFGISTCATPK